jgi:hypothetical protein
MAKKPVQKKNNNFKTQNIDLSLLEFFSGFTFLAITVFGFIGSVFLFDIKDEVKSLRNQVKMTSYDLDSIRRRAAAIDMQTYRSSLYLRELAIKKEEAKRK